MNEKPLWKIASYIDIKHRNWNYLRALAQAIKYNHTIYYMKTAIIDYSQII